MAGVGCRCGGWYRADDEWPRDRHLLRACVSPMRPAIVVVIIIIKIVKIKVEKSSCLRGPLSSCSMNIYNKISDVQSLIKVIVVCDPILPNATCSC